VLPYRPGRSASRVHEELLQTLRVAETASGTALLWFSDVLERHLYRQLGHTSIQAYGRDELGFSSSKTEQFLHLARLVIRFSRLRGALAGGRLTWTQVRTVAPVLTSTSEAHWVERAERCTRRELADEIRRARDQARQATRAPDQTRLGGPAPDAGVGSADTGAPSADRAPDAGAAAEAASPSGAGTTDGSGPSPSGGPVTETSAEGPVRTRHGFIRYPATECAPEIMTSFTVRLRAVDRARVERLIELVQKRRHPGGRAEILLAALERLAESDPPGSTASAPPTRVTPRPPYQVVVAVCPRCRQTRVPAGRGDQVLDEVTAETLLCDADVVDGRGHRRSVIAPSVRRRVLARDGHRCVTPHCGATRFLEIHHRVPVGSGGTNHPSNLITLCHRCHRAIHEMVAARAHDGHRDEPRAVRDGPISRRGRSGSMHSPPAVGRSTRPPAPCDLRGRHRPTRSSGLRPRGPPATAATRGGR